VEAGNFDFEASDTVSENLNALTDTLTGRPDMAQVLQNQIFHFLSHDRGP